MAYKSDVKELLEELEERGYRIDKQRRSAHYRAYHPDGGFVVIPSSTYCARTRDNTLRDIRKLERENAEKKTAALKVFGVNVGREYRMVAARTQKEACALLRCSYGDLRDYGLDIRDPATVQLAVSNPEVPFRSSTNLREKKWEAINAGR